MNGAELAARRLHPASGGLDLFATHPENPAGWGELRLLPVVDGIVNETMRSGVGDEAAAGLSQSLHQDHGVCARGRRLPALQGESPGGQ